MTFYRTSTQVGNLQRELKQCKSQMAEQHKTLVEYSNRMDEYDKKNEETNRKFSTLLQVRIDSFYVEDTKKIYLLINYLLQINNIDI